MLCFEVCFVLGRGEARRTVNWACWHCSRNAQGRATPLVQVLLLYHFSCCLCSSQNESGSQSCRFGVQRGRPSPLPQGGDVQSRAVLPLPLHQGKDDFLGWPMRKRQGKFMFLFLLWNRQIYTGPTETERCFLAHLKLQSKEISWSLAPSIGGNFHPACAVSTRVSYEVEQFLASFPERLLGTSRSSLCWESQEPTIPILQELQPT